MKINKCSMFVTPCVCIEIDGTPSSMGFPYIPDDGGLISEFTDWLIENKIPTVVPGGHLGGGSFKAFYSPEDAEKIIEWLKGKGNNENVKKRWPSTQKWIAHHDDDCEEELDEKGYCPICKIYPDTQSKCLWPNPDYVEKR